MPYGNLKWRQQEEDLLVAYLSDPAIEKYSPTVSAITWGGVNWSRLAKSAKMNGVLLSLHRNIPALRRFGVPAVGIEAIEAASAGQEERLSRLLISLCEVVHAFEVNSADVLVFKTLKVYPHVSSDVDQLARNPESVGNAIRSLRALGYTTKSQNEPFKLTFENKAAMARGEWNPSIDLYSKISWRGLTYFDCELMWQRRRTLHISGTAVYVPSAEDEMLIACVHSMLKEHFVTLDDFHHVVGLLRAVPLDWEYIHTIAEYYGFSLALFYFLCIVNGLHLRLYTVGIVPNALFQKLHREHGAVRLFASLMKRETASRLECWPYIPSLVLIAAMIFHKAALDVKKHRVKAAFRQLYMHFREVLTFILTIHLGGRFRH